MNIEVIDIVEALKIVSKKDDIKQSDDNKIGNIGNFIVYKTKHFTDIRGTTYGKSEDNVARTKGVTKQDMIDVITKFLSIKHITIEDIGKEYEIIYKKNDLYNKLPIAIQANYNPNKISIVLKTIIAHNRPSPNNYNHNANQERVVIERILSFSEWSAL